MLNDDSLDGGDDDDYFSANELRKYRKRWDQSLVDSSVRIYWGMNSVVLYALGTLQRATKIYYLFFS